MYKKWCFSVVVACAVAHNVMAMEPLIFNDRPGDHFETMPDEERDAYFEWLKFNQIKKDHEQEKAAAAAAHKLSGDKPRAYQVALTDEGFQELLAWLELEQSMKKREQEESALKSNL